MNCALCRRVPRQVGPLSSVQLASGRRVLLCDQCNAEDPMREARLRAVEERLQ